MTATSSQGAEAPRFASSGAWEAEGQRLRDAKKAAGTPPVGLDVLNAADFAYKSQPIDITGPGKYVVLFGPVAPSFSLPVGIAFNAPPDAGFSAVITDFGMVEKAGQRYVQARLEVSAERYQGNYPGFVAWIS